MVGFNKDFISSAAIEYDKKIELREERKRLVKKFAFHYFMFYELFCVIDNFTSMYNLHIFISSPNLTQAGYLSGVFHFASLVGSLLVRGIGQRVDIRIVNCMCAIVCAILLAVLFLILLVICAYML